MLDMESTTPLAVIGRYFDALSAKDFATVAGMFADDIVWHQPGANRFSGTHRGSAAVNEMIRGMMAVSGGTFELALTAAPMVNGLLVAAAVRFAAQRDGTTMAIDGVDLLRVEGDGIAEVWLFTADQQAEDAFWGPG
jgi:ketosteroid isomerase-like protein